MVNLPRFSGVFFGREKEISIFVLTVTSIGVYASYQAVTNTATNPKGKNMNAVNVSKKSWHYSMVTRYLDTPPQSNFCPYFRQVIYAIAFCLFLATLLGLLGLLVVHPMAWLLATIVTGYMFPPAMVVILPGVLVILGIIAAGAWVSMKTFEVVAMVNDSDNILVAKVHAWHEKICPDVSFVGGDQYCPPEE